MNDAALPQIFSTARRAAAWARMARLQTLPDAPRYLARDAAEDLVERLAFLRHEPRRALLLGDLSQDLGQSLTAQGTQVANPSPLSFDLEAPYPDAGFDLIAALFVIDTANDLPGALIHMHRALAPGGRVFAVLAGAGSLPMLRAAMLAADGERPAPRLHPQVDVRAGGQLLQRAGWADPVVDSRSLPVRFGRMATLVADLRAQGLSNVLADPGPPLTRAALARADAAFGQGTTETFEIITLSGRRL